MARRVLITGGTGFIGSRLAQICLASGEDVRILGQANTPAEAQNVRALREQGFEIIEGSVLDRSTGDRALQGVDVVYHLAAAQHEAGKSDQHFYDVNVQGTRNMLEGSVEAGVKRFVHGSTIGVYQSDHGTVREDTPTIPDNIYGVTKLAGERVVASFQERLPLVVIRISETYGPGDRRLLKLFRGIQKGRYVNIGKGANLHHPVYVDNLVAALRLAADSDQAVGQTLVTPGFEVVTTLQMVTTIAEVLGVTPPRLTLPLGPLWIVATGLEWTMRPLGLKPPIHRRRMHFYVKSFDFSSGRAHQILGYQPQVSFAEGVKRTADWYRGQKLIA